MAYQSLKPLKYLKNKFISLIEKDRNCTNQYILKSLLNLDKILIIKFN